MLSTTCILGSITSSVVPTFTKSSSADAHRTLASKYKISQSIVSFLYTCPSVQPLIGSFARSKDFILALASLYGPGLTSVAKSFGGSHALLAQSRSSDNPDDWPRTWIQTKVALIELFALLDLGVAHPTTPSTPFLDHPLIADYHHAYNLSDKLSTTLMPPNSAAERDPRLDRLETLFAIHPPFRLKSRSGKITVKSESILVPVASTSSNINTNTEKDESASLEPKTTPILAILPHLSQSYVTRLLRDDRFGENVDRILEGLLDGCLGSEWEDVGKDSYRQREGRSGESMVEETRDAFEIDIAYRRNVFDDEELDITRMRVGKQELGSNVLQDRSAVERMKRDILRRMEEMEDAEAELFEEEEACNRRGRNEAGRWRE